MGNSLADLFYNTVPGALLLTSLVFIFGNTETVENPFKTKLLDGAIETITFIAISLLIGFILQATSSLLRKWICFLDEEGFSRIIGKKEEDKIYKAAKEYLRGLGLLRKGDWEDVFHTMDNYIRAHVNDDLIKTFNSRMSFWSNIGLGAFIIFAISLFSQKDINITVTASSFILFLVSFCGYKENFRRTYDTVLKTFWSTLKIDGKLRKTRIRIGRK